MILAGKSDVWGKSADLYVVSRWVKGKLGSVKSVKVSKSGIVWIFCASSSQRQWALSSMRLRAQPMLCFALRSRAPLIGVTSGVTLSVEVDQIKKIIPGICDAHRLVRCRPSGNGKTC